MSFELFNESLINENKNLFDSLKKTNLHAHALLSSNQKNFMNEFHRPIKNCEVLSNYQNFDKCIKDNLSELIANKESQLKLYELSILTAIDDGVSVFDISVDYKSVYRIFDGSICNYINEMKKLKDKYKNKIILNYDLGINREGYMKEHNYLIKKLIESKIFNGIDLIGDELSKSLNNFKKIYKIAKNNNLVLKAHIGEYGDAKSIKKAIKILKLNEIQHGISIVNNEKIMKYAKKKNIIFNVCISSNLVLLNNININNHPIRKMYDYGLKVTINTDDELIFNSSLFSEYLLLYKNEIFNSKELYEILNNGLKLYNLN